MSGFDEREKSFEAKYKRDQETLFRITSRRNRLLGLWVAEQLGMPDNQALDYAKEVVLSDFEEPGDDDVVRKVLKDFDDRGIDMDEPSSTKQRIPPGQMFFFPATHRKKFVDRQTRMLLEQRRRSAGEAPGELLAD